MTIWTIDEAAQFRRLSRRTLYLRKDIPRVREGHRVLFLKEDLEAWVLAHRQGGQAPLDGQGQRCHHRSPALRVDLRKGRVSGTFIASPRHAAHVRC